MYMDIVSIIIQNGKWIFLYYVLEYSGFQWQFHTSSLIFPINFTKEVYIVLPNYQFNGSTSSGYYWNWYVSFMTLSSWSCPHPGTYNTIIIGIWTYQWLFKVNINDNWYKTTDLPISFKTSSFIGLVNWKVTNAPTGIQIASAVCRDVSLTQIGSVGMATDGVSTNYGFGFVIGI